MTDPTARIVFLGTGTSHGVPMIGCRCPTCRSSDPRDRRLRPSIHVTLGDGTSILVDASPDLRQQALTHGIERVDVILFTHGHADHVLGLDEVRRFNALQGGPIPCYGDRRTIREVRRTFAYVFSPDGNGGGIPQLELRPLAGAFGVAGMTIVPVPIRHGQHLVYGYRLGDFAYLTDCNAVPDASWPLLAGVRWLVVDALRERPHPTHFTVAEALQVVERVRPERAWLTHICHDLAHASTCARLPAGVALAHDGLTLDIP